MRPWASGSAGAVVVIALLLTGCAETNSPQGALATADGKRLYKTFCASCHGANGANDRQGANPAMRLKNAVSLSDEEITSLILNGRGAMPAFRTRLKSEEVTALVRSVRQMTAAP